MAKFPKRSGKAPPKDDKPKLEWLTKAELIRTVKTLSARQTKLLNRIAKLEQEREGALAAVAQDAVNSAMEVRQPLRELCADFSADDVRFHENQIDKYEGAVTDRLPERTGAPEYVDDATDMVPVNNAREYTADEVKQITGRFPWEPK